MDDLAAVVVNLIRKRDRQPGHEAIRPLLLVLPGGMRGAAGAGVAVAMHQAGLSNVFTTVVGISTGAPIVAYFLSGSAATRQGASLYYQDLATPDFINLRRVGEIIRLQKLLGLMTSGPKAIDVQVIQSSSTEFFVGVTSIAGQPELLNAKTAAPSLLTAIHASMAMPGAGPGPVVVNGQKFVDGGLFPFPLRDVVERFRPTDIFVIPNFPQPADGIFHLAPKDFFGSLFVLRTGSLKLTWLAILRRKKLTDGLREAEAVTELRVGILWPPNNTLNHFTTDPVALKLATQAAGTAALETFGRSGTIQLLEK